MAHASNVLAVVCALVLLVTAASLVPIAMRSDHMYRFYLWLNGAPVVSRGIPGTGPAGTESNSLSAAQCGNQRQVNDQQGKALNVNGGCLGAR